MIRADKGLPVYPETPRYWKSLEELTGSAAAEESSEEVLAHAEGLDRRDLFKLAGVSFALAGLTACTRQPAERIVPYVRQPEEMVPGKPLFFATAMTLGGYATGLLVESNMGRPTKAEGNTLHPASLGATDTFAQAALYGLYDPDRSQTLTYLDEIRAWPAFLSAMRAALERAREGKGRGLAILTETVGSPALGAQLTALLQALPQARWHQWEPDNRDNARAGAIAAFGEPLETVLRVEKADVILSLDADFLACGPGHLVSVKEFAERRRVGSTGRVEGTGMNRLYAVESTPGVTGACADHRLPMRAADVEGFARSIAALIGIGVEAGGAGPAGATPFARAVAKDLAAHRGRGLVLAGDGQPPEVHALAHAINAALGNSGQTVFTIDPIAARSESQVDSFKSLVADMEAGKVDSLVILGGNPAFTAPADVPFAGALEKVKFSAHLASHTDETSAICQWHVPEAHFLESWSDGRAFDGTASIVQPLIAPLYGGKTAHEVVAALTEEPEKSSYEIVRDYWKAKMPGDFEAAWRQALHDGVIEGTAFAPKQVSAGGGRGQAPPLQTGAKPPEGSLEIIFRADPTIHDGRFANNGWLQELPKPITKLTWDNALLLAPATAARLEVGSGDLVRLTLNGRKLEAPVWILPGHAPESATLHFGYGRTRGGKLAAGAGSNAYALRASDALSAAAGLEISRTGRTHSLATTQTHQSMEGRAIIRAATLEQYEKNPKFAQEMTENPGPEDSLYPPYPREQYAWAMAIDLNACTGCNACVVACQAENNIPIVGKTEVARGRAMHWIRVDRYFEGAPENPRTYHQPVPCMHCENAPCELVCPVAATAHSAEGLNDMVYNRCVGTKYCSNNCPYKVRRFNFFHYSTQFRAPSMRMLANPDVTVRWRGVMEKCTYCVQRINRGKIDAELQNRRVRDGEITPACAQVCPAGAIVFGSVADPDSRVAALKRDSRNYALLSELGTRPRTTYLAALRNPNPEIA